MPAISSGMDAEEETEHHYQLAITTETLSSGRRIIPTPEAKDVDYYRDYYDPLSKEMIKKWKRGLMSQEISLIDEKPPDYNLDTEDEAFRKTLETPKMSELDLERVLDKLEDTEKSKGPLPPFCKEWNWGKGVIDEQPHHETIHKYWVKKRTRLNGPIKYHLLREKPMDCTPANESYICFRRRLDKIQTRRNKQRDQSSYTRMVKLRRDLTKLLTLCNLMKRREIAKKEIIDKDFKLIDARLQAEDYKNEAFKKVEHQKAKEARRLLLQRQRERKLAEEAARDLAENFAARPASAEPGVKRKIPKMVQSQMKHHGGDHLPKGPKRAKLMEEHQQRASNGLNGVKSAETPKTKPDPSQAEKFMFRNDMAKPGAEYLEAKMSEKEHQRPDAHFRLFSTQHRTIGLSRRRVGRGGRIITDRAFHSAQSVFESLPLTHDDQELTQQSANSTLRQVMDDIKKMRSRHFQPGQARKRKRAAIGKKR